MTWFMAKLAMILWEPTRQRSAVWWRRCGCFSQQFRKRYNDRWSSADTFWFYIFNAQPLQGINQINDFDTQSGDVIHLQDLSIGGHAGIHDFANFLTVAQDTPAGVYFTMDNGVSGFVIANVSLPDFSSNDVQFSSESQNHELICNATCGNLLLPMHSN
ncbi:hypothetical protein FHW16_005567 [Phyllobacterium myrsinacearum]|uniref:Uncharacterized protein n=2 Tax=Phyllobacterium myrsinacearum TaxID=28101 RepID=A0A839EZD8_9HYPH|nr:hypothetical protein [Phyllobacterium myrsinacearum]